jgi:hypothetical protein
MGGGDTFLLSVSEPGYEMDAKSPLRGLDCADTNTTEGKAVKRFIFTATLIARASGVTICTSKPVNYDRYLADVLFMTAQGEIFLNKVLLATGHVVPMGQEEMPYWAPLTEGCAR